MKLISFGTRILDILKRASKTKALQSKALEGTGHVGCITTIGAHLFIRASIKKGECFMTLNLDSTQSEEFGLIRFRVPGRQSMLDLLPIFGNPKWQLKILNDV